MVATQQRHCRGRGQVRLRRMLKQGPDLGRDDVEAGRHREDRRHAELCQRLDESDKPAGQQRRQYHRQRHPAQRVPAAAAKDRRGVLEIGRNVVERVRDQHEDIRKAVAGHREDDAVRGVDVDDMLVFAEPEPLAGEPVEDAAVRCGEDFPGDRAEKGRGHERGGDKGANEPAQRQVGARHQPGERQGRRRRPQRNAGGDFECRQIWSREARIGRQAHEIGRSQRAVIVGDAVPDEPSERQQNQAAQKQREQDHDRSRQVDRADCPFTGARQRDGHRDNTIVCAIIEPRPPAGAARGFVPSLPGTGREDRRRSAYVEHRVTGSSLQPEIFGVFLLDLRRFLLLGLPCRASSS